MEIWEDISTHIVRPCIELAGHPLYSKLSFSAIKSICLIYFQYDMKIRELNSWLVSIIASIEQENNQGCLEEVRGFNTFLNEEYEKIKQEFVKFMIDELSDLLEGKGVSRVIFFKES